MFLRVTLCFIISFFAALPAFADSVRVLMDAEASAWLKNIAKPLAETANLPVDEIDVRLIIDENINAFVTAEKAIYVNTGLILRAESVKQVIGVMAHELGHLKAQHHFRLKNQIERGRMPSIVAAIAGIGAIAAGAPEAGQAILLGSQAGRTSQLLSHSRGHEAEADKWAFKILNANGISAGGMVDFFEELRGERLLYYQTPPEYLTTHPLSERRLASIQYHVENNEKGLEKKDVDEAGFARIKTKIAALTASPAKTLRITLMEESDDAKYASAIAYALQGKLKDALGLADELLAKKPNDAFYSELVALILVDMSQVERSLEYFERSLKIDQSLTFVRVEYADALLAAGKNQEALVQLNRLRVEEPEWASIRYRLGVALGRLGRLGESHLELAEEAWLKRNRDDLKLHIAAAKQYLKENGEIVGENSVRLEHLEAMLDEKDEW